MPEGGNKISVFTSSAPALMHRKHVAVGMKLAVLQQLVQIEADEQAPHFPQGQEPISDGRAYQATNGRWYYRPNLIVAQTTAGPEVRFLKDAQGKVRLEFGFDSTPPAGMPQGAQTFNVRIVGVILRWMKEGQLRDRSFENPTLVPGASTNGGAGFSIRVGADLGQDEYEKIEAALKRQDAQAQAMVDLSYGYWIDTASPTQPATTPTQPGTIPSAVIRPGFLRAVGPVLRTHGVHQPVIAAESAPVESIVARRRVVLDEATAREQKPGFRKVEFARSVPFTFPPDRPEHRRIYGALEGVGLEEKTWTQSEFGWIRGAPFANTIYRLPDEVRLAFNADLGTPHMLPFVYRESEQADLRVRVVLRAEPWHNPATVVRLRDWLRAQFPGVYGAPVIVAGGWEQAKLRLTGAFPEHLRVLEGADIGISLERGFEVRLDLSQEFYRLLCQQMVDQTGLTGEVDVTLQTVPPGNGAARTLSDRVPVRLTLDDLAAIPVQVAIGEDDVKPTEISVANETTWGMRFAGCEARLLQYDDNSIVPLDVYDASTETPFPVTLAGGKAVLVKVKPKSERPEQLWNAIQVELIGQELMIDRDRVLDRIHELAPPTEGLWKITVECPVFLQDPLPQRFQNLHRVDVRITRAGFATQQVVLGKNQAKAQVKMQWSLRDIVRADTPMQYTYRVRNIYFDHEGRWSDDKTSESADLFIFPNPTEND